MSFKIVGGTPKSGKPLCYTCKSAQIVRGQRCEELIFCQSGPFSGGMGARKPVPFRVAECAEFHPKNMPYLYEMEKIAWHVEARKKGAVGFSEPETELEVHITPPKPDPNIPS